MADVDTGQLSAASTGDRYGDAVTRLREAAAHVFLTDVDAPYAAVGHFARLLINRLDVLLGYVGQVEDLLQRRLAAGGNVRTSAAQKALAGLTSTRTVLGQATVAGVRADIVRAANAVGGTSLDALRSELAGIRAVMDPYLRKTLEGVQQIQQCIGEYDQDVPERYLTGNRVPGVIEALSQAADFARRKQYDGAIEKLAVAAAGLNIPGAVRVGRRADQVLLPYAPDSETTLTSTKTYPMQVESGLTLLAQVVNFDGTTGRSLVLPAPASVPAVLRTGDLSGGVRVHAEELPFVTAPYPVGDEFLLTFASGTAVITGDLLVDASADFIADAVRVTDAARTNVGAVEETFFVSEVVGATTLRLSGTPLTQGAQSYLLFAPVDVQFAVDGAPCRFSMDITVTPVTVPVLVLEALFNIAASGYAVFSHDVGAGTCTVQSSRSSGGTLSVHGTRFYDLVLQAGVTDPPHVAAGAANDVLSLVQGVHTAQAQISLDTYDAEDLQAELLSTFTGFLSAVDVETGPEGTVLVLSGFHEDSELAVDTGTSTLAADLAFQSGTAGHAVTVWDLDAAWAHFDVRVSADQQGHAVVRVIDAPAVLVDDGDAATALGLPAGTTSGEATTVVASGIRKGDVLTAGAVSVTVADVIGSRCRLSAAVPVDPSTLYAVTCGGVPVYGQLAASPPTLFYTGPVSSGLDPYLTAFWETAFRMLPATDRTIALREVSRVQSALADVRAKLVPLAGVSRLPELDSVFFGLQRFSLGAGEWYLASLSLDAFFFGSVQSLRESSALLESARRVVSEANTWEE